MVIEDDGCDEDETVEDDDDRFSSTYTTHLQSVERMLTHHNNGMPRHAHVDGAFLMCLWHCQSVVLQVVLVVLYATKETERLYPYGNARGWSPSGLRKLSRECNIR